MQDLQLATTAPSPAQKKVPWSNKDFSNRGLTIQTFYMYALNTILKIIKNTGTGFESETMRQQWENVVASVQALAPSQTHYFVCYSDYLRDPKLEFICGTVYASRSVKGDVLYDCLMYQRELSNKPMWSSKVAWLLCGAAGLFTSAILSTRHSPLSQNYSYPIIPVGVGMLVTFVGRIVYNLKQHGRAKKYKETIQFLEKDYFDEIVAQGLAQVRDGQVFITRPYSKVI